jgi:hypothetical protein
MDSTAR